MNLDPNPYAPPRSAILAPEGGPADFRNREYAGFWLRVAASVIDGALTFLMTAPALIFFYGTAYFTGDNTDFAMGPADFVISYVFPAVATIIFWLVSQATPGKMAVSASVVDAKTGKTISAGQAVRRYLGYFLSLLPFGLGFLWAAFDRRHQAWHDKLAGTVVITSKRRRTLSVRFSDG
ncbi:MAG: hypothetical protein JWM59_2567 [Verrucomicrobiales bacterium]|nr:hypothetical protein [Verrucomicrobiales bacterium]